MMQTIRKIAIFFDGTWNKVNVATHTNVKKLKDLVVERYSEDDTLFLTDTFYSEGPGTHLNTEIVGGAFAADLPGILQDAFLWASHRYLNAATNGQLPELYVFGFSRGAYLAHVFSWLLNDVGLLLNHFSLIPSLIDCYVHRKESEFSELLRQIGQDDRPMPIIRMLGLWDMVTAPLDPFSHYHHGELSPIVRKVYHAMSLDEGRLMFPVLKYQADDQRVVQRWFSGVHSDVGGGFEDTTLSDIALEWMADMATNEDLILKASPAPEDPDYLHMEKHTQSFLDTHYRSYADESIDGSVYDRMDRDSSYHPHALNFPE